MTEATISYKDACEAIARAGFLQKADGTNPTAEEIFAYSPTGELYMVHEWYAVATALQLDEIRRLGT